MPVRDFTGSSGVQQKVSGADVYAWFGDGSVKRISPGDGFYIHPCIHPQGTDVLFYGAVSGPSRLFRADLATFETTALSPSDSTSDNAVYSFDGEKIIFCSDRSSGRKPAQIEDVVRFPPPVDGVMNIFMMDSGGESVRQVTYGPHQDQRPCLSPDGQSIVFVSNRGGGAGQFRLWMVPADGSEEPKIINSDVLAYRPWFSRDGALIYFFASIKGRNQICKIPAKGGDIVPMANDDKGDSRGPFVDPNNDVILMHSTRGGPRQIWELPLDGKTPPRLLQPPGFIKATHATRGKNGVITFDVWRLQQ